VQARQGLGALRLSLAQCARCRRVSAAAARPAPGRPRAQGLGAMELDNLRDWDAKFRCARPPAWGHPGCWALVPRMRVAGARACLSISAQRGHAAMVVHALPPCTPLPAPCTAVETLPGSASQAAGVDESRVGRG